MSKKKIVVGSLILIVVVATLALIFLLRERPSFVPADISCQRLGGDTTLNYRAQLVCNLKTKDSGRVCTDSSECEGYCRAPGSAVAGSKVSGFCSKYQQKSTDYQEVVGGVAGRRIIIN